MLIALSALGPLAFPPVVSLLADEPPIEFGAVAWGRELEPALAAASKAEKPVLLLFQEVPG